jgi:ketol-acid reductoisomerase
MKVYYEKDADLSLIKGKRVTIVGYGSQGHAHALNLNDSGVKVTVGLRKEGASWDKAKKAGLKVAEVEAAVEGADVVMMLMPDEHIAAVYKNGVEPHIKKGATLAFAHGFNIHYRQVVPRGDLDVVMIAPKAPGHTVRSTYVAGGGVPDADCRPPGCVEEGARRRALLRGGDRRRARRRDRDELPRGDRDRLFGEQAVLCGGLVELIKAGYETLIEAGYAPEMAYFECLHEVKLIVDLIYEGGIANMNYSISNNAEYGEYVSGSQDRHRRDEAGDARGAHADPVGRVRAGLHPREPRRRADAAGAPPLTAEHSIEQVGEKLRSMMPWISKNKLVDQSRN